MIARAETEPATSWSELPTRRLLRKLHVPGALDDDPLAQRIALTMRQASPREGVYALVKRTLLPFPAVYWIVVQRMEVEGASTADVARELRCSQRTVFRYRACAMSAIRRAIDAIVHEAERAERSGRWQMSQHRRLSVTRTTTA